MSLFTKLVKKSVKDFLQRRKKWIISMVIFLIVLIGINYLVNHYVGGLVGTLIKEFVAEKSEGFYHVEFDDIAYILNSGTFYVSEFKFDVHPNYQQDLDYDELPQQYIYTSIIPRLHIDIIDFWSIFVHRELKVIGIEITSPFISIVNLNKSKTPKKISFEAGNLYGILSGNLNELKINDFLITDGEFDYKTHKGADYDNFKIKGLTFEVNNFRLNENSIARKDKIFYTDDIRLEIKDQLFFLKDSLHKVTFDKFYISTSDNEFGFENFRLTRRDNPHLKVQDHDHYEVSLPNLRMSGIDFMNAYNNNLLVIDSISIATPVINVRKRTQSQRKDTTRNKLLDVAMIYHDYLVINHFNLNGASLIYTDERSEIPKQYSIDNISAYITKVEIDTVSHSKYQYGFNFDDADLHIKDYEVTLPDSANTVKFEEFSITSNPFEISLRDLQINPSSPSGQAAQNNQIEASIPYLVIREFDLAQAINKDTFLIDEIYMEDAAFKMVQLSENQKTADTKRSTGGLFGAYEIIQQNSKQFILDNLNVVNGKFSLEKYTSEDSLSLSIEKINVAMENLIVDSLTNTKTDLLGELTMGLDLEGSEIKTTEASLQLESISYNSFDARLRLKNLAIAPEGKGNLEHINLTFPELIVTGIKPNEILYQDKISLDSLKFRNVNIFVDLVETYEEIQEEEDKVELNLPYIEFDHLVGIDYDIRINNNGFPLFTAQNINFDISGLSIDQNLSDNPFNQFDYDEINLISIDRYELLLQNQQHLFNTGKIQWNNSTQTFSMEDIKLAPTSRANNEYDIEIPKISMTGINLKKVLKESYYYGNDIIIEEPSINLKLAKGRQQKLTSLDLGFIPLLLRNRYHGMRSNTFEVRNASINVRQQADVDSLVIEGERMNVFVEKFEVDSTTEMVPNRFLFANDVRLSGDYLSTYQQANSNFVNINHYDISTGEGYVLLNGIYFATNTNNQSPERGHMRLSVDDFHLHGINFFDLTQNRTLDIDTIRIDNASLLIEKFNSNVKVRAVSDSLKEEMQKYSLSNNKRKEQQKEEQILEKIAKTLEEQLKKEREHKEDDKKTVAFQQPAYLFDTLLLRNIAIDRILLTDSKVDYKTTNNPNSGLLAPDIWLMAEGVKYDPVAAQDSSRLFYSDNIQASFANLKYVLPDNLSAINIDDLDINMGDSTIYAINFALIPLVDRYEYGKAKGFQSTWLKLENDSVTIQKADFLGLINNQNFHASTLNVYNPEISVFRDKRVPFPEWQRRPLPQTNLRSLAVTFGIDTINMINGFITYQEHGEKARATGEVYFSDMDAKILNLTNDSIRMMRNPNARIGVTTKLFGVGAIRGEFLFDLIDMKNIHSYGIDVAPFDLTEFNRIMIPSASVEITSGVNNRIIMSAKADEDYSYGEMKFYYEDLKIQLLNRETETPRGLGNVLGSFFANTFIIRSNNPRNLFLRKGDIFFERDKKRAIFNYWTKTFLSGVVSSIGATNNKKKIKKMQEENLKKLQEEKKYITRQ